MGQAQPDRPTHQGQPHPRGTVTVTGIASGYDVFGGGATQDTDGVKDLSSGYAGGFAGLNDEGVLADDHMVYADTIRGHQRTGRPVLEHQTQVRMGLQHHERHPRTGR